MNVNPSTAAMKQSTVNCPVTIVPTDNETKILNSTFETDNSTKKISSEFELGNCNCCLKETYN